MRAAFDSTKRPGRGTPLAAVLLVMMSAGCSVRAPRTGILTPSPQIVRAALSDQLRTSASALAKPEEPERLRPCCAFGLDLKVRIGSVPVPGFEMRTMRALEDLGAHDYGAGLLQNPIGKSGAQAARSTDAGGKRRPATEHNGIVYTCRGGFLDTAHTRDFADLTFFLAGALHPLLPGGGTIELAELGGQRRIVVEPVAAATVQSVGRSELAIAMAQWLTFELSVWREIATWYGHESVPPWPEKISSFSLEDLYSNLLGTKIAGGILRTQRIRSEEDWNRAMDAWLPVVLAELEIVPEEAAADAMRAVDGLWWDSKKRVPDWKAVPGRCFDVGGDVAPWLVAISTPVAGGRDECIAAGSTPVAKAMTLRNAPVTGDTDFTRYAWVEVDVSDELVQHDFPSPRPNDRRITQADFETLVRSVRRDLPFPLTEHRPKS